MDQILKQKIIDYIREQFPEPMSNHFTYELVENVITFADENMNPDMTILHISNMIPELKISVHGFRLLP